MASISRSKATVSSGFILVMPPSIWYTQLYQTVVRKVYCSKSPCGQPNIMLMLYMFEFHVWYMVCAPSSIICLSSCHHSERRKRSLGRKVQVTFRVWTEDIGHHFWPWYSWWELSHMVPFNLQGRVGNVGSTWTAVLYAPFWILLLKKVK